MITSTRINTKALPQRSVPVLVQANVLADSFNTNTNMKTKRHTKTIFTNTSTRRITNRNNVQIREYSVSKGKKVMELKVRNHLARGHPAWECGWPWARIGSAGRFTPQDSTKCLKCFA